MFRFRASSSAMLSVLVFVMCALAALSEARLLKKREPWSYRDEMAKAAESPVTRWFVHFVFGMSESVDEGIEIGFHE